MISVKAKEATKTKESFRAGAKVETKLSAKPELKVATGIEAFDESIADNESYREYADAVLGSFPFQELLNRIRELLNGESCAPVCVFR
jgi:hypothetical protein